MSAKPCPMAPLVEALHDGRLGRRESTSIERHLASCTACCELARDNELMATLVRQDGEPLSPLEHQRNRVRLLREAAMPARQPPRWRSAAMLAFAIGALVLVVLGSRRPSPPALALLRLPAPPVVEVPTERRPRRETIVTGIDDARFERTSLDGVETVRLETGIVELSVRPLRPGERFLVRTGDAVVEVRGTIFRVEAEASRIRAVSVTEGVVEITCDGRTYELRAGGSWTPPALSGPTAHRSQASPPAPPRAEPSASASPAAPSAGTAVPKALVRDEASKAFAEGVASIDRGDYAIGIERLEAFRAKHPDDARAEDAAFLRIVAFQRAGRPAAAAVAARRYLVDFPNGSRRREAEVIAGR